MELQAWITLGVIGLCFLYLISSRYPPELILFSGVVSLLFLNIITIPQLLIGFANEGMATVAILYIVAAGLTQTGVVSWLSTAWLGRPKSLSLAQTRLMLPVAIISSVLNNTPVVAMLIPAVNDWSKRCQFSVSQLMIPLSYAAIVGGTCTLAGTSTNLIINDMINKYDPSQRLEIFDLAWIGIPLVITVTFFILTTSRWLLPKRFKEHRRFEDTRQYIIEMLINDSSPIIGKSIEEAGLRHLNGVFLVKIQRHDRAIPAPSPSEVLYRDDRLFFAGDVASVVDIKKLAGLRSAENQVFKLQANRSDRCLVEVAISPRFPQLGKTVRESNFRSIYGAAIIAVSREGEHIHQRIGDIELKSGDTLLLEAHQEFIQQQKYAKDFLLVSQIENSSPVAHDKRLISISLLAMMIFLIYFAQVPILKAALFTAAAMLITQCISVSEARASIHWDVLFVISSSIALGIAMESSGAANNIAEVLISFAGSSPITLLASLFFLTAAFSAVISNIAAAVLMFPIALASSQALGVNLTPLVVTIMIAASASFATPIGYQTNLMVYGPGDYRFMDFVRIGVPLTAVVGVVVIVLIPIIWPL